MTYAGELPWALGALGALGAVGALGVSWWRRNASTSAATATGTKNSPIVNPVKRQYANRPMATSRAARGDRSATGSRQASAGSDRGASTQTPSEVSIEVVPLVHVSGPAVLALQLSVAPVGANSRAAAVARATRASPPHQRESRTPSLCPRSAQEV